MRYIGFFAAVLLYDPEVTFKIQTESRIWANLSPSCDWSLWHGCLLLTSAFKRRPKSRKRTMEVSFRSAAAANCTFSGAVISLEVVVDAGVWVAVFERLDGQLGVDSMQVNTDVVVQGRFIAVTHHQRLIVVRQLVAVFHLLQRLRKHAYHSSITNSGCMI